jgi:hypothetical protein
VDDPGQDVGQLRGDQQQPLGVLLGRRDLQQRHDLVGAWRGVGDQRQVGQLQQLLHAHPGVPQRLDHRPGPKGDVLLAGQVNRLAGRHSQGAQPHRALLAGVAAVSLGDDARVALPVDLEALASRRGGGCGAQPLGQGQVLLDAVDEAGQQGGQGAGALVHPRADVALLLERAAHVLGADRAGRRPLK